MENRIYNGLQLREVFHLGFLQWLGRKLKPERYALKGGSNLRFFYGSIRYSEDMDLDVQGVPVQLLIETVMKILKNPSFLENLVPFGISEVVPPDMGKAKQTETTQRFKVHLITGAGEDLFTKIEFSRRGFKGSFLVQSVSSKVLRTYKMSSLMVSHYDIESAIIQKVDAIVSRSIIQPRDIFDLHILMPLYDADSGHINISQTRIKKAVGNILQVGFRQFRDTVLIYLAREDQNLYDSENTWDEVKLKTVDFVESLRK